MILNEELLAQKQENELIVIKKTASGYSVRFPYALKEVFRETFPSAKWASTTKLWNVGPRSGTRLEAWKNAVSDTAKQIVDAESAIESEEINAKLIDSINAKLATILSNLKVNAQFLQTYSDTVTVLEEKKAELTSLKMRLANEALSAEQAKADLLARLKGVLDMPIVAHLRRDLALNHKIGRRAQFNEAKDEIYEIIYNLRSIGLKSRGLSRLYNLNFNRPDRDKALEVSDNDILDIDSIED